MVAPVAVELAMDVVIELGSLGKCRRAPIPSQHTDLVAMGTHAEYVRPPGPFVSPTEVVRRVHEPDRENPHGAQRSGRRWTMLPWISAPKPTRSPTSRTRLRRSTQRRHG